MGEKLLDLPDRIETERLVIRPHRAGDGRALCDAIVESLAELRRWPAAMGWALEEPSEEQSEAFCRICERIGMQFEGLLRNERAEPGGRLRNTRVYAAVAPVSDGIDSAIS